MHLVLAFLAFFPGQDVPPLTAAETAALETITESRTLATVSFLASDELGGRDTPSPELNIAAAYVASRFRAAGLEGLGPDGSYYQETTVKTTRTPAGGVVFRTESDSASRGLLFGGPEAVSFEGEITPASENSRFEGPAWLEEPKLTGAFGGINRLIATLIRTAATHQRAGATALIVVTRANSPLVEAAKRYQGRPRMVGRRTLVSPLPILLVSAPPSGTSALVLPATESGEEIVRNVIAVRRGSDAELSKQAIVFSAHLDHIGQTPGGDDTINNGADDDATGVTSVLALADAYAALPAAPARSTVFMTFWGEEKGLIGSKYFCDHPLWPLDQIVANINIEMVGRPEKDAAKACWMTGWNQSNLGTIMAGGADRAGIRVFEHPRFSAMLYGASDNASFVRVGVVAHSFSAGSLHADYHKPSDEWEKLEIPHMTAVIRGLFAGSLPIAHGQQTPKAAKAR